jgi:hypothetical protein
MCEGGRSEIGEPACDGKHVSTSAAVGIFDRAAQEKNALAGLKGNQRFDQVTES